MIHADYVEIRGAEMAYVCTGFFFEEDGGLMSEPMDESDVRLEWRLDALAFHFETMDTLLDSFIGTETNFITALHDEDTCPFLMGDVISFEDVVRESLI